MLLLKVKMQEKKEEIMLRKRVHGVKRHTRSVLTGRAHVRDVWTETLNALKEELTLIATITLFTIMLTIREVNISCLFFFKK